MRQFVLFIAIAFLLACSSSNSKYPHVEIRTKFGDIEIELYPDKAPKSVAAFLSYIEKEYYKDATFYRVLNTENQPSDADKAELIQGGAWRKRNRPEVPGIPHESTAQTHILHTNGTVSFARREPGTASTEFFICIGDQPGFDYGGTNNPDGQGYAAFGKVVKGLDVVRKIYLQPENDQYFDPAVAIYNIVRL